MKKILIGKIVNTFGIKGELKIESYSDFDRLRYKKGSLVYLKKDGNYLAFEVNSYRQYKNHSLISFKDMLDINLVEKYKGLEVYKDLKDIEALPKGQYYFHDLIGLNVYFNGESIGIVKDMEEGVKYNYLRILKGDKEALVPYLSVFVKEVNLDKNYIELVSVEGLL